MGLLVDEARGRTLGSEHEFAVCFPVGDEVEGELAAFHGREIKLLVIRNLQTSVIGALELCEQEGAGTRLQVLARAAREDLHATGGRLLVRGVLFVVCGGLAYDLLDLFELEYGSRMGGSGKANEAADYDRDSFHSLPFPVVRHVRRQRADPPHRAAAAPAPRAAMRPPRRRVRPAIPAVRW